jgi:hypothetical protein
MQEKRTEDMSFRQRLDAVLRTLDVKQVQEFLIAEHQWQPGQPANPEYAMWMMIAGSPALSDLHPQARSWLISHGYETEANAVLNRGNKQGTKHGKGKSGSGPRPQQRPQFPKGKKRS